PHCLFPRLRLDIEPGQQEVHLPLAVDAQGSLGDRLLVCVHMPRHLPGCFAFEYQDGAGALQSGSTTLGYFAVTHGAAKDAHGADLTTLGARPLSRAVHRWASEVVNSSRPSEFTERTPAATMSFF